MTRRRATDSDNSVSDSDVSFSKLDFDSNDYKEDFE